jgi:hypothetical protein
MSRLLDSVRTMTQTAALVAVLSTLAACGGGSSASTPAAVVTPPAPPAPPTGSVTIVGVQTPDSVSVVTATNAN